MQKPTKTKITKRKPTNNDKKRIAKVLTRITNTINKTK